MDSFRDPHNEFNALQPPSDLAKFPLAITAQPSWGYSVGPALAVACHKTLDNFPSSGRLNPMWAPVFAGVGGGCPISVYVTHPSPWRPNVVSETWENIHEWSRAAVAMSVGNTPDGSGWTMDLVSRVQICFWEPLLIDPTQDCSDITWYDKNPSKSVPDCLNQSLYRKKVSDPRPTSRTTATPPDVKIGIPRPVPSWKTSEHFRSADCLQSITFTSKIAFFAQHIGIFLQRPWIWRFNDCVSAIWLTTPPTDVPSMRPPANDINFQHEMSILLRANMAESQGLGFMDLENGWQILFYQYTIDPENNCRNVKKVNLRTCLDKRVTYGLVGSQAESSTS